MSQGLETRMRQGRHESCSRDTGERCQSQWCVAAAQACKKLQGMHAAAMRA